MLAGVRVGDKFEKLEKGDLSEVGIADVGINFPIEITFEVGADATGAGLTIFDGDAPFKFEIIDVIVQGRPGAAGGGSMTISDGTTDITDAIACISDTAITRAGTIDDAKSTIEKGGTLDVTAAQAADRGFITIVVIKV